MINKVEFDMSVKFTDVVKQKLQDKIIIKYKIPVEDIHFKKKRGETHEGVALIFLNNKNIGQVNCHYSGGFKYSFSSSDINYFALRKILKKQIEDLINQFMREKDMPTHLYSIPPCTWGSKLDVFIRIAKTDKESTMKLDFEYKANNWIIKK
ncbi:MAG: hypothetical protein WCH34_14090 [Bacteroidota bacterium]